MIKFSLLIKNETWCTIFNISRQFSTREYRLNSKHLTSSTIDPNKNEESVALQDNSDLNTDDVFETRRNKSGLRKHHYQELHKKTTFLSEDELEVMPLWKYRKRYGRYGSAAGIELKSLWPCVQEMELMKEKESLEYPHSVHEMIKIARQQRKDYQDMIIKRQEELKEKVGELDKWKETIRMKVEKKEKEAAFALKIKQQQIDEVREIIGFQISPFDPKFKEVLDKKLEEDKKKAKKEKKLRKQQIMLDKLTEMAKKDAMLDTENSKQEEIYGKKIK